MNKKLFDKGKQKIDTKDLSGRRIYRRILKYILEFLLLET